MGSLPILHLTAIGENEINRKSTFYTCNIKNRLMLTDRLESHFTLFRLGLKKYFMTYGMSLAFENDIII